MDWMETKRLRGWLLVDVHRIVRGFICAQESLESESLEESTLELLHSQPPFSQIQREPPAVPSGVPIFTSGRATSPPPQPCAPM